MEFGDKFDGGTGLLKGGELKEVGRHDDDGGGEKKNQSKKRGRFVGPNRGDAESSSKLTYQHSRNTRTSKTIRSISTQKSSLTPSPQCVQTSFSSFNPARVLSCRSRIALCPPPPPLDNSLRDKQS